MMGSEIDHRGFPGSAPKLPPPLPRDEMESVALTDDYRSAMSSSLPDASSYFHPLSAVPSSPNGGGGDFFLSASALSQSPRSPPSFVDPPSYADAIFSPFQHENGTTAADLHDSPSSLSRGSSLSSPSLLLSSNSIYSQIAVSSPQKEQETTNSLVPGANTYITYLITTRSSNAEYSVRRRFRDVVTLSDRLAESYRGYFIPVRPDKNVVESQVMQKNEFVEQRRAALEKYLCRLVAHPVIGKSEELRVFLQVTGKLPLPTSTDVASRMLDGAVRLPKQLFGETMAAYVAPQDVVQPAKGGMDLLRIFKELKQSVANDWSGVKPLVVEEDKEFLEQKVKVQDMEQKLTASSQQAEAFVKAQQEYGETMGELGLTLIKLTKFETEEAVYNSQRIRAADIRCVATAAVKASRFYRELNAQAVKHLHVLHEYLGMMLAVHGAFSDRHNALLTVQTLLSELSSLQVKTEKLEAASSKIFGGDRSRIRKVEELKEAMKVTEDAKSVALKEYERIKENNKSEIERLDRERHDDFFSMLKGFVVNQVGYAEKIACVWEKVAEETSGYAD